ncbi:diguanylate cyclase domain-containing protein [Psychrobium sp. 1_MG-2023]|uniref:diguanylate cyclase domain-containing protein n=1 Tax=Psychrobium sp. 1_MG-2023 TaxID=3062624 RepID=UPI0026C21735|nr:diguanylate cyclase [Psychrobium sp. 1_MG-2023]MDP2561264.1 diguanylate cyclase [Psychrobium sp. 1_MG-2023]
MSKKVFSLILTTILFGAIFLININYFVSENEASVSKSHTPINYELEQVEQAFYSSIEIAEQKISELSLDKFTSEEKVRLELLKVKIGFYSGKFEEGNSKLKALLKREGVSDSIKSKIYYLLSAGARAEFDIDASFYYLNLSSRLNQDNLSYKDKLDTFRQASHLFLEAGNYEEAENAIKNALLLAERDGTALELCNTHQALLYVYSSSFDYRKLEKAAPAAIELCKKINAHVLLANIYIDYSFVYADKKDYQRQQALVEMSLSIAKEHSITNNLPQMELVLAGALLNQSKLERAKSLLDRLIAGFSSPQNEYDLFTAYHLLARYYEKKGQFSDAHNAYQKYLSHFNRFNEQANGIQAKYLAAQFQSTINQKESELESERNQLNKSAYIVGQLDLARTALLSLLLLSFSAFYIYSYRSTIKLSLIDNKKIDQLTGLCNVDYGIAKAFDLIKVIENPKQRYGLIVIDIDDFTVVNQSLGIDKGDIVLELFSRRLCNIFKNVGMPIYLGNDRFVVFTSTIDQEQVRSLLLKVKDCMVQMQVASHTLDLTTTATWYYMQGMPVRSTQHIMDVIDLCNDAMVDAKHHHRGKATNISSHKR